MKQLLITLSIFSLTSFNFSAKKQNPGAHAVLQAAGYTNIHFTHPHHGHNVYWWETAYGFMAIQPDGRPTMGCVSGNKIKIHL